LAAIVYEGMFILDSNRFGRDHETVSGQIPAMVEKFGGEMLVSRLWEERRLAYPIKGQRKGTYWLTYFRLDSEQLSDLNRQCQITDDILRVLFLKVDPRIVDALVAHATSAPVPPIGVVDETKPPVVEDLVEDVLAEVGAIDAISLDEDDK
jgi:small subunit ribosomal protein S6